MSRELRALPVPTRPAEVLAQLPTLAAALAGDGPALLPVTDQEPGLPAALGVDRPVADRIALVIGTSGSTGAPKGALLASEAVKASAHATHTRLGGPGTWLLAMSTRYIGGLQVLIRSLLAGTEPVVADLTDGFRAETFTKAAFVALEAPGRHYTALVPTQLSRLMAGDALAALRGFDAIVMGGAAMPEALRRRCRDEGVNAIPSYGMSETASGCVYDGVPLDGVEIRLSDGRIDIRGPMLADGYRNFDGESPFVDGWFHTSDLGRRLPDGRLEVIGRLDDVINTGGVKVAPLLVERALTAIDGVTDACVVGLPDPEWGQVVAAAVVAREQPPAEEQLREAVRATAGRAAAPKLIRFVPALPLLGPGKVDRAAVAKALDPFNR